MDRPVPAALASPTGLDESSASGWDARTVWQERVRDPHLGTDSPRIDPEARSVGWDPLETWRLRVQRPRKHGR
jgi:hypothetical protein